MISDIFEFLNKKKWEKKYDQNVIIIFDYFKKL